MFYRIITNTVSLFRNQTNIIIFSISLLFFLGLLTFFSGFFTIPTPKGVLGFYRMEPPTSFEMFYMIFSALISSLIVTITIYSTKIKSKNSVKVKGKKTSAIGLATGIFGAVCPACLGINFLVFGNVFTARLPFLIPYISWIQMGGIVLLLFGLYFVAKSAYEKKCISCSADDGNKQIFKKEKNDKKTLNKKYTTLVLIAVVILIYQIATVFGTDIQQEGFNPSNGMFMTNRGEKININEIIESVTPRAGFRTSVKWNDVVSKMVKEGILDPSKLENILAKRYGQEMKPEWRAILAGQNMNLSINNDNAVFMMYVLWTLAKHNKNEILINSPFAKYFTDYDIGVGRSGYGDTSLLILTPSQQAIAKSVSENAYRPCCGNSTAAPDCSHGYSALGLIQLMASQGFSREEIFETFIKFNSFWFPETYIKNALYFKIVEGKDWRNVSKELIAGEKYSTLKGSYTAKNYLKNNFGF